MTPERLADQAVLLFLHGVARYWTKNLDLLLQVTGTEDFPTMERIYATLRSGALPEVVYGRIERPLVHLHSTLNELISTEA